MSTVLHNIGLHICSHDLWQVAVNSGGNRCRKSTVDGRIGKPRVSVHQICIYEFTHFQSGLGKLLLVYVLAPILVGWTVSLRFEDALSGVFDGDAKGSLLCTVALMGDFFLGEPFLAAISTKSKAKGKQYTSDSILY